MALSSRQAAGRDNCSSHLLYLSSDAFVSTIEQMKLTNKCSHGAAPAPTDLTQCKQFVAKHARNGEIPLSKAAMCLLEEVNVLKVSS